MMRLAVIVPHYRQAEFLSACLDSLMAQTRLPDEIIVVDSSPEDTTGIMTRYTSDTGDSQRTSPTALVPRVQHVVQPPDGVAAARNAGLAATTCELVAFLDADNIAATDRLEWQITVFESLPDIVLSHGALMPIDRLGSGYAGVLRYDSQQVPLEHQLGWLIARNRVATDTVCARRETIAAVGGFCETPGVREDYDLWLRMATLGRFHYIDAPLAVYRRHDGNLSNNEAYMFAWEAGALNRLEWPVIEVALRAAYPNDAERSILEGEVRLRRGEYRIAERHFLTLARQPRAAAALFHLSHLMMRRGSLDYAEAALRRALDVEPGDAASWNNLGVVLIRTERADEAADAFAAAVELRPNYQDAADNLDLMLHPPMPGGAWRSAWKVTRRRLRPQLMPMAAIAA